MSHQRLGTLISEKALTSIEEPSDLFKCSFRWKQLITLVDSYFALQPLLDPIREALLSSSRTSLIMFLPTLDPDRTRVDDRSLGQPTRIQQQRQSWVESARLRVAEVDGLISKYTT